MNLEKFTERSRGFLQAAQTIAMRESHQRLAPEHILKALMDDDQGLASNLIKRAGGSPQRVVEAVDAALAKLPKVSGDAGQIYMDGQVVKVLDEAEKLAKKGGDSFVRKMALQAVELSKNRAGEIRRLLVEKYSADAARLDTVGRGWEEPAGEVKWVGASRSTARLAS